MQRYFLEVMYDGTAFHGSQLQGDIPTVQLSINKALSTLLRIPIESFGASRTDEGVHALSNYYHFDAEQPLHPQLHYKLNALLPHSISVKRMFQCTGEPINARFDAYARRYRYKVYRGKNPFYYHRALFYPYKLNSELLKTTAALIRTYTDFESFSKRKTETKTFKCTIHESYWEQLGDQMHYVVKANRFLRGMVRGLVSTQLQVARGNITLEEFKSIVESKDCTKADFSVAGYGLYLEEIIYPDDKLEEIFLT